ncbi:hypothetical protein JZU61_05730 [bacterium]|nr:hypothetical protein [bacterium]
MKIKHRKNLIRLIFVHLLLLAYPLVSKTLHVHHEEGSHHELSAQACFAQPEEPCPVCDFEFYNFVPSQTIITSVALQSISTCNIPDHQAVFVPFIQYFSLRAPPAV